MTVQARSWFRFTAAAQEPTTVEIHIIDFIGDWLDDAINRIWGEEIGVTARAFVEKLAALPESVKVLKVHINSPGGDVFAALNIANALREQQASKGRTVETYCDGLAASAASIILMAGSTVTVADNALVMIHNPWTWGVGNAADLRQLADELDTVRNTIVATYKWHSSLSEEAIVALMNRETWMDAQQAIDNGFATAKVDGLKAAASISRRALTKLSIPEQFKARVDALIRAESEDAAVDPDENGECPDGYEKHDDGLCYLVASSADTGGQRQRRARAQRQPPTQSPPPAADVIRLCREGDCLELAEALVTEGASLDTVTSRISAEQTRKQQAATRAKDITALCAAAKLPELAAGYIAGAMPIDAVRTHLTTITAKVDSTVIDTSLDSSQGTRGQARIDTVAVYAARNRH